MHHPYCILWNIVSFFLNTVTMNSIIFVTASMLFREYMYGIYTVLMRKQKEREREREREHFYNMCRANSALACNAS